MCIAGTVKEKVKINQSNVLCQLASNCILTHCNSLQTGGLVCVDNFNAGVELFCKSIYVPLLGISWSLS